MDPYSAQMLLMNQFSQLSGDFIERVRLILLALLWVLLGLMVAEIVKFISAPLLRLIRWDRFCRWTGISALLGKIRADVSPVKAAAHVLFWLVWVSFLMNALERTEWGWLAWFGRLFFEVFPKAVAAAAFLAVAAVIAGWLARSILLAVEHPAALLAAGLARMLALTLGVHGALLTLGTDRWLSLGMALLLLAGGVTAVVWAWLRQPGMLERPVIRVNELEEVG